MKQINIVNAYNALEGLSQIKDFHSKEQWALYSLRKELRSFVDFYKERIEALQNKYKEFANEEGIISGKPYQDYLEELNELNDLEVDINIEKINLPFVDGITFIMAENLESFIDFTE